ncbi:bile acid:sodium symporter family protein [Patescibacteria group bacterium]
MEDFASQMVNISTLVFVVTSMLGMGLSFTIKEMIAPLKNAKTTITILIANFAIVPFVAVAIACWLPIDRPFQIGLILVACAAGAPFIPKLAQRAKANVAFSVGLMALLMIVTVLFLPIVLPLILHGVQVSAWDIARPLLVAMLLPLGFGMLMKHFLKKRAVRPAKIFSLISTIALVALLIFVLISNSGIMGQVFGTGAILAILILLAVSVGVGYLLGGKNKDNRKVIALGTGQRNLAAAMVVALGNFSEPEVMTMVIAASLIIVVTLLIVARLMGRKTKAPKLAKSES